MRGIKQRHLWMVAVVMSATVMTHAASHEEPGESDANAPAAVVEQTRVSYLDGAATKLGRGLANIITSPLELTRHYALVKEREGVIKATSVGVAKGLTAIPLRAVTGALEVATFWLPVPRQFGPIMQPEYVYVNGQWQE